MFSGIVEEAGRILRLERTSRSIGMTVEASIAGSDVRVGDSVAVNGCCLTAVRVARTRGKTRIQFDLLEETWRMTSFGQLKEGARVNLERSLRLNDRLGGHFVTGHVDGTGVITRWEPVGADWVLDIRPPAEVQRYLIPKGSVAVDGISLTVAALEADTLRIWIIPHTREVTNLLERQSGDRVNLEADLLGKYVERLIGARAAESPVPPPPSSKARSRARAKR
jgi:riboflavin synthase